MIRGHFFMAKRRIRFERQPNDVHSIESFCRSNGISLTTYFALKRQGKGPREMKVGKRILISPEAEADWRRERERDE
jgi:hypothetical protein